MGSRAAAPKGTMSCRTQGDFRLFVRSLVLVSPDFFTVLLISNVFQWEIYLFSFFHQFSILSNGNFILFRCVLASLYEVMSVGRSVGWSVGP